MRSLRTNVRIRDPAAEVEGRHISRAAQRACTHASLDHDLGDYAEDGGDAYALVLWMAEHDRWPTEGIRIYSANVVGLRRMLGVIDRYGAYPEAWTHSRGAWPS